MQTIKLPGFLLNPLYRWGDGWWIGRAVLTGTITSFTLVSPADIPVSMITIRPKGSDYPVSIHNPRVTKNKELEDARRETLEIRKRWYPFLRDYLWSVDLSHFDPQEFPVFVSDDVFERAAQVNSNDLDTIQETAFSQIVASGHPTDRSAIDVMERIFATQVEKLLTTGISLQLQETQFRFWWKGLGWGANRISSVDSGSAVGRTCNASSPSKLFANMAKAGIMMPASEEATWGPPGQLAIDVDFSMYQMLGLTSPLLESNAVYAEWIQALETATG